MTSRSFVLHGLTPTLCVKDSYDLFLRADAQQVLATAERTKKEIISEATYDMMFQLLQKLPTSCRHVVVLLTVPIVFPGDIQLCMVQTTQYRT